MIQEFINRYMERKDVIRTALSEKHPDTYKDLVRLVVDTVSDGKYREMDAENIVEINQGDYQGTLVYLIPEKGYQPHDYWYLRVWYGSCSGCDTLEGIREYGYDKKPDVGQVNDYMTLTLHIVEGIKSMGGKAA